MQFYFEHFPFFKRSFVGSTLCVYISTYNDYKRTTHQGLTNNPSEKNLMSELRTIVAARIKQCRLAKGWTGEETTRRLSDAGSEKFTLSTYYSWEQGVRRPLPEQIVTLGEIFGRPPAWLQGFTNNDSLSPVSVNFVTANSPSISTKAGVLQVAQSSDATAYSLDYLERRGLNKNKLLSIVQIDRSMTGVIEEGDECLLDREAVDVQGADLFGLVVNGVIWTRWIRPQLDGSFIIEAEDQQQ